jgi:hypothetical protein
MFDCLELNHNVFSLSLVFVRLDMQESDEKNTGCGINVHMTKWRPGNASLTHCVSINLTKEVGTCTTQHD